MFAPMRIRLALAAARRLVGLWRLVERTVSFANGTSRADPRTTAYIFYSDSGMTCYIAMDPTRAQDANRLILKVDPNEFRAPVVERPLWERVPVRPELAAR